MSSAAARGAAGWLHMNNRLVGVHAEDLKRERLIRERKESAAPRVAEAPWNRLGNEGAHAPEKPAARAPVVVCQGCDGQTITRGSCAGCGGTGIFKPRVVYKRKRRLAA